MFLDPDHRTRDLGKNKNRPDQKVGR